MTPLARPLVDHGAAETRPGTDLREPKEI